MGCQASLIVQADTPRKKLSRNLFTQHSVISNKNKRSSVMNEFQSDNKQQESPQIIDNNKQGQPKLTNVIKVNSIEHQSREQNINKKSVTLSLSQQPSQTLHHSHQSSQSSQSAHSNSHEQASSCQQQQSFREITITINKPSQSNLPKYNKRSSTQRNLHFDFNIQDNDGQMKQNVNDNGNGDVNNLDVSNNNSSSKYVTNSNSSLSVSLAQFNSYRMI